MLFRMVDRNVLIEKVASHQLCVRYSKGIHSDGKGIGVPYIGYIDIK